MDDPTRSTPSPGTWAVAAVEAGVLFALWLTFAGSAGAHECVTGAVAALVGAFASHVVRRARVARFAALDRSVLQAARLPKYAVTGTAQLLGVLARRLRGRPAPSLLLETPFEIGPADDASAATRRALAVALTTMTPSSVVLGLDRRRGGLVFHQVARTGIGEMTKRLGARP